jgi:hypothetical protein
VFNAVNLSVVDGYSSIYQSLSPPLPLCDTTSEIASRAATAKKSVVMFWFYVILIRLRLSLTVTIVENAEGGIKVSKTDLRTAFAASKVALHDAGDAECRLCVCVCSNVLLRINER